MVFKFKYERQFGTIHLYRLAKNVENMSNLENSKIPKNGNFKPLKIRGAPLPFYEALVKVLEYTTFKVCSVYLETEIGVCGSILELGQDMDSLDGLIL